MREQFGRYTLLKKIAVGGMGELYLAELPGMGPYRREVVVKRIRQDLLHDDNFVEMFLNEGRLASMFRHPNIVQIYELGQVDEAFFMAMEYVAGSNLQDIIERLGGPVELPYALHAMIRLCEGLDAAHDARDDQGRAMRLVHRDISPPNVLISFEGEVKLTDFGIAKVARQQKQTQAGVLKGKFAYLSPEQSMGEPIDRRSDIYALGLVLFEATIGRRANPGAVEVEQIYAASQGRVLQPSLEDASYPPDLERIYLKATAKAPRDRYQTAREMLRDLEDFQERRGLTVDKSEVGAFLRRLFPEAAPGGASDDPAGDTLPPETAPSTFDTAPTGFPAVGEGFEDDEATMLENVAAPALPPDQLDTLDSSGGMMVLVDEPDVDDYRREPAPFDAGAMLERGSYNDDFDDEETHVALARPDAAALNLVPSIDPASLPTQDALHAADILDPTRETDAFEPLGDAPQAHFEVRFPTSSPAVAGQPDEPSFQVTEPEGLLSRSFAPAPERQRAAAAMPSTGPQVPPQPFAPPPSPARPLGPPPGAARPSTPQPSAAPLAEPLAPPPPLSPPRAERIAQPLVPPPPVKRSRRSILWLLLGLLLVLTAAGAAAYIVFVWEGDTAATGPELPPDPPKVKVAPLGGSDG